MYALAVIGKIIKLKNKKLFNMKDQYTLSLLGLSNCCIFYQNTVEYIKISRKLFDDFR